MPKISSYRIETAVAATLRRETKRRAAHLPNGSFFRLNGGRFDWQTRGALPQSAAMNPHWQRYLTEMRRYLRYS
ncbi:MAG TPA: hypothetical protein PKC13_27770, partial [Blastocatellia bacterium]|nr:hypothetical protein [Blastocatellia bacterium]